MPLSEEADLGALVKRRRSLMTTQKREESEQISRADVEKRLATLSEADLNKLEAMAKEYNWCLKHSGRDHLDLLREAMFRTYRGTRKWKAKVDVFRHLDLAMRSIANSWLKKYRNAPLSQCETIQVDDEGNESDRYSEAEDLRRLQFSAESMDEFESFASALKERLQARGATVSLQIFDHFCLDYEPAAIMKELGIERKTYESQVKRLRRHAQVFVDEGKVQL